MRKRRLPAILALIFPLIALILAISATATDITRQMYGNRVLLFNKGDMGSTYWRIPALAVTNSGAVIAVADRRNDSNRDLPNRIDLVIRRSDDNGLTWSEPTVIAQADSVGGYGDAAIGVHSPTGTIIIAAAHGNGLWESTPDNYMRITVIRSTDDGRTWSQPVDITPRLYSPVEGEAPVKAMAGFASSGIMAQLPGGEMAFVMPSRPGEKKWGPINNYLVTSPDAGVTWHINPTPVDTNGDETKVAALADNSLMLSIRNRRKGPRHITHSYDNGATWQPVTLHPDLVDPACNGDLLFISREQLQTLAANGFYHGEIPPEGVLLQSLAAHPTERRDVSVLASTDSGRTFSPAVKVCHAPSSYSAMALTHDGHLLVLTEEDAYDGGFRLWLSRFPLTEIVNNARR